MVVYDPYHPLGATAGQWDVSSQVCVVIGDGAGGAVELNVFQVDVLQCDNWEHQGHLCVRALQILGKRGVRCGEHMFIPAP